MFLAGERGDHKVASVEKQGLKKHDFEWSKVDSPSGWTSPSDKTANLAEGGIGPAHVVVLAHRGASAVRPENTIDAFAEARRLGADGVELDVRRSVDGALVIHHDPVIAGLGAVSALAVHQLPPSVPLLEAALKCCAGMIVNVEIKSSPDEPGYDPAQLAAIQVASVAAAYSDVAKIVVSSFDLEAIDAVRSVEPDLATGLLVSPAAPILEALDLAERHGHTALHPFHLAVDAALVAATHEVGLAVNTWTVDDPQRIAQLAGWGVDAIITNRPDVALAALPDLAARGRG
jgi:glycerophosphoryl diester phosphodiesterase